MATAIFNWSASDGGHQAYSHIVDPSMEEILEAYPFIRVHHSHIVNINEVEKYIRGEGGYLVMSDGTCINMSRSRKELLLKRLSMR